METLGLPDAAEVKAAAHRLAGKAVVTPLLESSLLNERVGGRVFVKAEMLQLTGSFKFRGAYNRISQLKGKERQGGVVAYSSGNHAQAVAAAARMLGIPAVILMPRDAPAVKVANTKAYGAEVIFFDRYKDDREALGRQLAEERGAALVMPYDQFEIIAGQGTVGLEIAQQAQERGVALDAVLVPCGGGGISSGSALALKAALPAIEIYGVEPDHFDDTRRSLAAGRRVANDPAARSICDGLVLPTPGELTFALNSRLLSGVLTASDAAALEGMAAIFDYLKLVAEPSGAVGIGALLAGALDCRGKCVAVVCTGGNVDRAMFERALGVRPA